VTHDADRWLDRWLPFQHLQEQTIHRYVRPKAVWEIVADSVPGVGMHTQTAAPFCRRRPCAKES